MCVECQWSFKCYLVDGGQEGLQEVLVPGLLLAALPNLLDSFTAADMAQKSCRTHNGCLTRQRLQQKWWYSAITHVHDDIWSVFSKISWQCCLATAVMVVAMTMIATRVATKRFIACLYLRPEQPLHSSTALCRVVRALQHKHQLLTMIPTTGTKTVTMLTTIWCFRQMWPGLTCSHDRLCTAAQRSTAPLELSSSSISSQQSYQYY